MQGLVQVALEMNHEFEGLRFGILVNTRVLQNGEELLRLGDHAITVRALMLIRLFQQANMLWSVLAGWLGTARLVRISL